MERLSYNLDEMPLSAVKKRMSPGWVLVLLVVLLVGGVGIKLLLSMSGGPPQNYNMTVPVKTAPVQSATIPVFYQTVGTLETDMRVDLNPEVAGIIRKLYFTEGQWVSKGQTLVKLEADKQSAELSERASGEAETEATLSSLKADYQAKVEAVKLAQAEKLLAENEFNRYKKLGEKEFVSALEVDQRQTRLDVATANLAMAVSQRQSSLAQLQRAEVQISGAQARYSLSRANFRDTVVTAPFSGQIGQKYVAEGDYVMPPEKLLTLVNADPLKVSVPVPERYANYLKLGLPIEIKTANNPGKVFEGKLVFVDPVVSADTRSILVKAHIPNGAHSLQPGQFVTVRIILGQEENAILVPEESIIPQGEKYAVYVAKGKKAEYRFVTVGTRLPGKAQLTSGVQPGERVIIGGIQKLSDGAEITELKDQADAVKNAPEDTD